MTVASRCRADSVRQIAPPVTELWTLHRFAGLALQVQPPVSHRTHRIDLAGRRPRTRTSWPHCRRQRQPRCCSSESRTVRGGAAPVVVDRVVGGFVGAGFVVGSVASRCRAETRLALRSASWRWPLGQARFTQTSRGKGGAVRPEGRWGEGEAGPTRTAPPWSSALPYSHVRPRVTRAARASSSARSAASARLVAVHSAPQSSRRPAARSNAAAKSSSRPRSNGGRRGPSMKLAIRMAVATSRA